MKLAAALTSKAALNAETIFSVLPLLLVWLWASVSPQMELADADSRLFLRRAAWLLLQFLPLLLAQALLSRWLQQPSQRYRSWGLWLCVIGMLGYPALLMQADLAEPVRLTHWLLALGLSGLYWLHFAYQYKLLQGGRSRWPWLWSLDAVLILLLLAWTISWTLLLVSHPPGLAEQPIPVQLNWQRILQNPGLCLSYFLQFSVLSAVIWLCYWLNRYWLIRRILARYGFLPFVLLSLLLMLLSYPLLAMLLLQLPMNAVALPAVPAGGHNPFDGYNFFFMVMQWCCTTPLILAFDRQQQESTLAQIQHQQIQTELQLLQQQINPHFLFNTLNNLYALCLMKSDNAPNLILQLADLLRYGVYQGQQARVTLRQELDYIEHYLALQQLRVSNKTTLQVALPSDVAGYQLPPLLLIMLVENAYKHGVENSAEPSWIRLTVAVRQHRLYLRCDNSRPATVAKELAPGLGLDNLRRRLQLYYGADFMLLSQPDGPNWRAELQLDLDVAPAPDLATHPEQP